ncbi:hypothetical protein [Massilia sp. TWR1-2-2]|uniref:hypothetical protein n=1 Tax=Massilia sp. TWR1-2-2 TaxID=2804584 RepID=UPI003CEABE9B
MFKNTVIKSLLGVSATVVLLGAFSAQAQKAAPVTGEANDHTSAGAEKRPEGKVRPMNHARESGAVKAPKVGEANDHTSPNATRTGTPKVKPMGDKVKSGKVKAPVTGEANDHSSAGGTTEAAKAAKAAKAASM